MCVGQVEVHGVMCAYERNGAIDVWVAQAEKRAEVPAFNIDSDARQGSDGEV